VRGRLTTAIGQTVRGAALFLGAFVVVGLIGEARGRATDVELWFVDLRDFIGPVRLLLLIGLAGSLIAWSLDGRQRGWPRRSASVACILFAGLAIRDVAQYGSVVATGLVRPAAPVPLSLVIALLLLGMAAWIWRDPEVLHGSPRWVAFAVLGTAVGWAAVFPLAQIAFFGTTDYRRPADAAVVFGARVYATGLPSPLLADRIATGVELYRSGLVPILVMSGGDGADGFNEAKVMRDSAVAAGVPLDAIVVDLAGVSTDATVANSVALLVHPNDSGPVRIIAVSQPYHLPRIQLAYSQFGIDVLTVPATDPIPIGEMPLLVTREIPAFWGYYLRACLG
jgi:vancomycin permeability regulator SanA